MVGGVNGSVSGEGQLSPFIVTDDTVVKVNCFASSRQMTLRELLVCRLVSSLGMRQTGSKTYHCPFLTKIWLFSRPRVSTIVQDLSVAGAAMGYLTFAGHAVDVCINLLGIVLLQRARRKVRRYAVSASFPRSRVRGKSSNRHTYNVFQLPQSVTPLSLNRDGIFSAARTFQTFLDRIRFSWVGLSRVVLRFFERSTTGR